MSRKFALIIGNTEYSDPGLAQLKAPGKDAEDLARVLNDPDIGAFDDVTILLDKSQSEISESINAFFDQKKPDDLLVLYFSGHGVRDDVGDLYLAVKNTKRVYLESTAVSSEFIRKIMNKSRSNRQVLILDCCNSGAFSQGTKAAAGVSIGTATAFEGGFGRIILTASDSTQFAFEGDRIIGETDNSLFTHYLVEGLEGPADLDGDGRITVDELYGYVYEKVKLATPKQTPSKFSTKEQGEIVLRERIRMEDIRPVPLPDELLEEIEDPRPYVREAAVQKLERILKGRNVGMARSAREALEKIIIDDNTTRRVAQLATEFLDSLRREQQLLLEKAEEERAARERAEAEKKAEEGRLARERAERDALERAIREEAQYLVAERLAKEKAEREVAAKAEREKQEIEAARKAEREGRVRETAEKANRDQTDREAAATAKYDTKIENIPAKAPGSAKPWFKRTKFMVAVIGLVGVLFAAWVTALPWKEWLAPTVPTATSEPTPVSTPAISLTVTDPVGNKIEMGLVRAGTFTMGSDSGRDDEKPVHPVTLEDYYMDVYEVTNKLYTACVKAGGCTKPYATEHYNDSNYANHPVVYVDWNQAKAYCAWRDARLPTEAEWEKAARGTDGRTYPWGEGIDSTFANYDANIGDTTQVGNHLNGKGPYGMYDMTGNVWEWVADWYDPQYYSQSPESNPLGPSSGQNRVLRGGSWNASDDFLRVSIRVSDVPNYRLGDVGFRCARSVASP